MKDLRILCKSCKKMIYTAAILDFEWDCVLCGLMSYFNSSIQISLLMNERDHMAKNNLLSRIWIQLINLFNDKDITLFQKALIGDIL
jgi:hypothetical protein